MNGPSHDEPRRPPPASGGPRDPLPFDELYRTHAAMLLRVVVRQGVPVRWAEDVAHEVWCEAFQKLATHFDGRDARSWRCEIGRNRATDWLRRKANQQSELKPTMDQAFDAPNSLEANEEARGLDTPRSRTACAG